MTVEWVKQGSILGPVGPVGPANEMVVGTVETLPYTEPAWVTISPVTATPPYQVISFGIPQGLPGEAAIYWDDVLDKPATFPPTLPIPSSGVTGLDAKQASQDAAIAAIDWSSLPGKPVTFPPTLPVPWTGISGKPTTFPPTVPISWSDITGQPATYPPTLPIAQAGVTNLTSDLAAKAPLASPALTGAPTAPTAAPGTNSTQIASTAFVAAALATTGASVGTTAPPTSLGKFWWHPTEKTLRIWDGTAWEPVLATWA